MSKQKTIADTLLARARKVGVIRPLARMAGIEAMSLSRFVAGRGDLSLGAADKLAKVLGVGVVITEELPKLPKRKGGAQIRKPASSK